MIPYIFKSAISMAILIAGYYFFLGNEKSFTFNRFYLMFSLFVSLSIPFMKIDIDTKGNLIARQYISFVNGSFSTPISENHQSDRNIKPDETFNPNNFINTDWIINKLFPGLYIFGVTLLLARFLSNILALIKQIRAKSRINLKSYTIIKLDQPIIPYSFFKWIFVNKNDFENGNISNSVMKHEEAHVRQLHSLDIIFLEILQVVYWFNPMIFFYKRAVKTNHEYLADESVTRQHYDLQQYSNEILDYSGPRNSLGIACGFDRSLVKQRLSMLIKNRTMKRFILKIWVLFPLAIMIILSFAFVTKFPESLQPDKGNPDKLKYFTGTCRSFLIDDSTFFYYGELLFTTESHKSTITAKRLKVSREITTGKGDGNYCANDFLQCRFYSNEVDVYTSYYCIGNVINFSAGKVNYSGDSLNILLTGNAIVQGADLEIKSENIVLYLKKDFR